MLKVNKAIKTILLSGGVTLSGFGLISSIASGDKPTISIPVEGRNSEDTRERIQLDSLNKESVENPETTEEANVNIIQESQVVRSTTYVNIRKSSTTSSDIIGLLPTGRELDYTGITKDNFYEVIYEGSVAYVSCAYSELVTKQDIIDPILYTVKIKEGSTIYDYDSDEELYTYDSFEVADVYNDSDEQYLVQTTDYIGYVDKEDTEVIEDDTFVVVDISEQMLYLYENGDKIFECPVITGKPSSPTYEGEYYIFAKNYNRYLRGQGYNSYVDYFMPFNKGIGFHDSEYHSCNGVNHGWRSASEFSTDRYLTDGSHGCVNMLHDDVEELDRHVDVNTKVLVKK